MDGKLETGLAPNEPVVDATVTAPSTPLAMPSTPLAPEEIERLTTDIVAALKTVYDPEIPSDIYELGLIYKIDVSDDRLVTVDMTLTAPGCPVAGEMPIWVENAVNTVAGISGTKVNLVFSPPWTQARMSDEAKLAVGMF
jgi:FeS assembly SUF system protein